MLPHPVNNWLRRRSTANIQPDVMYSTTSVAVKDYTILMGDSFFANHSLYIQTTKHKHTSNQVSYAGSTRKIELILLCLEQGFWHQIIWWEQKQHRNLQRLVNVLVDWDNPFYQ